MKYLPYLLAGLLIPCFAVAQGSGATGRENPDSSIPFESGNKGDNARQERWSDFLPIFGKDAREQGYVLPRPFGVSLGYMGQKQPFSVDGLEVEGVDVKGSGLVDIDEVDNQEDTVTLRFDGWLFPFLNLYGILGKTDGHAEGPMQVNLPVSLPLPTSFEIDYKGDVRGGGITIAGGYKDFFGMIDSNYTLTDLDISTTDAKAWVTSTRFGWNGKLGIFNGALWIGAMYQDINQTLDLEIPTPSSVVPLLGPVIDVSVEQSTKAPWNTVAGGRWEFGKGFEMLAEFGFGQRRSNMITATYRF